MRALLLETTYEIQQVALRFLTMRKNVKVVWHHTVGVNPKAVLFRQLA
jgi:hypothetical protein